MILFAFLTGCATGTVITLLVLYLTILMTPRFTTPRHTDERTHGYDYD